MPSQLTNEEQLAFARLLASEFGNKGGQSQKVPRRARPPPLATSRAAPRASPAQRAAALPPPQLPVTSGRTPRYDSDGRINQPHPHAPAARRPVPSAAPPPAISASPSLFTSPSTQAALAFLSAAPQVASGSSGLVSTAVRAQESALASLTKPITSSKAPEAAATAVRSAVTAHQVPSEIQKRVEELDAKHPQVAQAVDTPDGKSNTKSTDQKDPLAQQQLMEKEQKSEDAQKKATSKPSIDTVNPLQLPVASKLDSQPTPTPSNDTLMDIEVPERVPQAAIVKQEVEESWYDTSFMDDDDPFQGSSRIPPSLEIVGPIFPEIYDLPSDQASQCRCGQKTQSSVYGLENSKHYEGPRTEKAEDLRRRILARVKDAMGAGQNVTNNGRDLGLPAMAITLLVREHVGDCPYVMVLRAKHPLLFGVAPAVAEGGGDDLLIQPSHLRENGAAHMPTHEYYKERNVGQRIDKDAGRGAQTPHMDAPQAIPAVPLSRSGGRGIVGGLAASKWA